jgi:glucose-1-phosphate cytidylyltransferase
MKVVILAGGLGTRISEYTDSIPKPMIKVGGEPLVWHIMNTYASFGHEDFYLALGYKAIVIKDYFANYKKLRDDFKVDLSNGNIKSYNSKTKNWKVSLIDTGEDSMTGGRVKRMKPFIGDETFMLTYGDGLSDVDIDKLLKFHRSHGKMVTVCAVRPGARFGELDLSAGLVKSFKEKPQTEKGWINGGYFVIEPEFFELIEGDDTIFEQKPLEKVAEMGELMAFEHHGFWQCVDTKRDLDYLQDLWMNNNTPWINN